VPDPALVSGVHGVLERALVDDDLPRGGRLVAGALVPVDGWA
jgi:hypothetical protein